MADSSPKGRRVIDPTGKKKIILSIDGGGMRGAISIAMLAELEKQAGIPCNELFDMVVGTSTGAIIAVGLAIGYSAKELLQDVYYTALPNAFRATQKGGLRQIARIAAKVANSVLLHLGDDFLTGLLCNRLRYAYPMKEFREQLSPLLEKKKIYTVGELPNQPILLVTTKDISTGETLYIVNAGPGEKDVFQNWPLTGIVAASGAAPLFFPPVLSRFVDGGVGVYSNPCLAAATEAIEFLGFERDGTILLSLGTGYVGNTVKEEDAKNFSALQWGRYVILESLDDAALQQVIMTRAIYGVPPNLKSEAKDRMDFRRYNPFLDRECLQNELGIVLTPEQDPSQLSLDSFKVDDINLMVEIGTKYAAGLDWSKSNVDAWETTGGHPLPKSVYENQTLPYIWENSEYAVNQSVARESRK